MLISITNNIKRKLTGVSLLLLLLGLLIITAGCAANQQQSGNNYSQEKIAEQLTQNEEVFKTTWSPDNTKVVYIQTGKTEKNGMDEAYIWRVGEEKAVFVRDVSPTTHGFTWSPNSLYFVISEKLGDGSQSSIINAATLTEGSYKIKSITIPVWSPDSNYLAYGNEQHDYGESWGSLEVYTLGAEKSEPIWYAKNYLYKVTSWNDQGNIGYTEIDPNGHESTKTTKNIRASISGVHLGDTMDQVRAALGNADQETPPGEEIGHFPEQVYRWDYDAGYRVFIGAESGKVLEINTTSPKAETNLGIKVGDTAAKVFEVYRPKYIEPESIHGGKLYGLFKVEGAAALSFSFDIKEEQTRANIKNENIVIRMILTYPEIMDDSF